MKIGKAPERTGKRLELRARTRTERAKPCRASGWSLTHLATSVKAFDCPGFNRILAQTLTLSRQATPRCLGFAH